MAKLRADYIAQSLEYRLEDAIRNDMEEQIRDEYGEVEGIPFAEISEINGKDTLVIDESGKITDDVYLDDGHTKISDGKNTLELFLNEDGMVEGKIGNREIGSAEADYELEYLGLKGEPDYIDVIDYSYSKDGLDSSWSEVMKGSHKKSDFSDVSGEYNVNIRVDPQKYLKEKKQELQKAGFDADKAIKISNDKEKMKDLRREEHEMER